jgi:L-ascorbate metabolism protein UlaG (beta-lactamase superfamily)
VGEIKINEELENNNEVANETQTIITEENREDSMMDGITVNYHASIRLEKDGEVIYFDPFKIEETKNDADYVFITHSHYDHYSEEDIKKVMNDNTKFIVTSDLESKVKALGVLDDNVLVVYPNEEHNIDDISFETVPAYNTDKTYHKKSNNWVGYVVDVDGVKYYVVGDSDVTDEFKSVMCDVIFVPVGGTYTMTDAEAAFAVNEMKPKYAIPVHYGEVGVEANAENFVNGLNDDVTGIILK